MGRYLLDSPFRRRRVRGLAGPMGQVCVSVCVVGGVPGDRVFFFFFLWVCDRSYL
jgi:hypothetical protein